MEFGLKKSLELKGSLWLHETEARKMNHMDLKLWFKNQSQATTHDSS